MLLMYAEENHECSKPQNESLQQAVPLFLLEMSAKSFLEFTINLALSL